jgi:hypothetical protein
MPRFSINLSGACEANPNGFYQSLEACQEAMPDNQPQSGFDREIAFIASEYEPEIALSLAPSEQREYIRRTYGLRLEDYEASKLLPLLLSEDVVALYKSGIPEVMDYVVDEMDDFEKVLLEFVLLHPTKKRIDFPGFVEQVDASLADMFEALNDEGIEFDDQMFTDIVNSLLYILNDQLGTQIMYKQDRLTLTGKAIELITRNRALIESRYAVEPVPEV